MSGRGAGSLKEVKPRFRWTSADLFAIAAIVFFSVYLLLMRNPSGGGVTEALILRGGEQLSAFSLDVDRRIELKQYGVNMVLEIEGSRVRVLSSDCKQQICVRQGWITEAAETLLCLPNNITVELKGSDARYDAISR